MKKRKIAVITTSRADYGHLFWTLKAISAHKQLILDLIVCGSHLNHDFGYSIQQIRDDGFLISAEFDTLVEKDTDQAMAQTISNTISELSRYLADSRPDLLLVIADRYEMLAPASVALCLRIPIAHVEGGDISQGAIDDQVRNALTKMSHLHFVPSKQAHHRVIAMGEAPWRVHTVGALSLDHLRESQIPSKKALELRLGITLTSAPILVTMHPLTLCKDPAAELTPVLEALSLFTDRMADKLNVVVAEEIPVIFCFPNADTGYLSLVAEVTQFCHKHKNCHLLVNLEHTYFWRLLMETHLMIGNSSSGIMETGSLALPTINVGDRQKGRLQGKNIINCRAEISELTQALNKASGSTFKKSLKSCINPYDAGKNASELIVNVLATVPLGLELLRKEYYEVTDSAPYFFKLDSR